MIQRNYTLSKPFDCASSSDHTEFYRKRDLSRLRGVEGSKINRDCHTYPLQCGGMCNYDVSSVSSWTSERQTIQPSSCRTLRRGASRNCTKRLK